MGANSYVCISCSGKTGIGGGSVLPTPVLNSVNNLELATVVLA